MKLGDDAASKTRQLQLAPDDSHGLSKSVVGINAIDETIHRLSSEAASQVDTVITGNSITAERLEGARSITNELYNRGVVGRSLYLDSFREIPGAAEYVQWLNENGASVRTLPTLPRQMIIYDKKVAILAGSQKAEQPSAAVYRDQAVVDCLQALFELNWISASPLGKILGDNDKPILSGERVLLDMLSMGNTYREIGDAMNVNERTIARRVAELMERLDSKSLFMLGVRAAKRNWV